MVRCFPWLILLFLPFEGLTGANTGLLFCNLLTGIKQDTVVIGLLVNEKTNNVQIKQAAQVAVDQANTKKSNNPGLFYKLETRVTDGPWGQASKKVVELV